MPKGITDDPVLNDLRGYLQDHPRNAAKVAQMMGVERTLIWRVSGGKAVLERNRDLIAERIELARTLLGAADAGQRIKGPADVQKQVRDIVAHAVPLLHRLIEAIEALEETKPVAVRPKKKRRR